MNRDKNLPLTETVFYVLSALSEPAHGYAIMQKVEQLSGGQVRLAAGTLYGAIENLLGKGFITSIPSGDVRRKVYVVSQSGKRILRADRERMRHMLNVSDLILGKGEE